MNEADVAILAALNKSTRNYVLLRVGSSCSNSREVMPSDLDYICVDTSDTNVRHHDGLTQMEASFSGVPQTVGFDPNWPSGDAQLSREIQTNLGRGYLCSFRFGPLKVKSVGSGTQLVHFAGPLSGGDFRQFTRVFPVLSYMFLKFGIYLRGNEGNFGVDNTRPHRSRFVDLLLANCERGRYATTQRALVIAAQKTLLLRSVWHEDVDPYHCSRIAAKTWSGQEMRLLGEVSRNPDRFLLQEGIPNVRRCISSLR